MEIEAPHIIYDFSLTFIRIYHKNEYSRKVHITQKSAKNHRNKNDRTKSRQNVQFYSFYHPIHVQTSVRFKMLYVYRAFMSKLYAIQAFRLGLISKTER